MKLYTLSEFMNEISSKNIKQFVYDSANQSTMRSKDNDVGGIKMINRYTNMHITLSPNIMAFADDDTGSFMYFYGVSGVEMYKNNRFDIVCGDIPTPKRYSIVYM